jgi:hypothetical protein
MEFLEAPGFSREVYRYLSEEGFSELQRFLTLQPGAGDIIPGTGGFRKLRWFDERRGKGRRGGLRVVYYFFLNDNQIWLFSIFNKNEMTDLSPQEKKRLKNTAELELSNRKRRTFGKPGEEA